MDRYARQRTLAQVGDAGQERIFAATYRLPSGTSKALVEREYLERAGANQFVSLEAASAAFAHASAFRHLVARDFAEGAWRALGQLKRVLVQP